MSNDNRSFWTDGQIIKYRDNETWPWETVASVNAHKFVVWTRQAMFLTTDWERKYLEEKIRSNVGGIIVVPQQPKIYKVYDRHLLTEYLKAKHGINIWDVLVEVSAEKEAGQHTILRVPVERFSSEHAENLKAEFGEEIAVEWVW